MYNLLIADDEELERRAIKSIIIKSFDNRFNMFEVKNGREAIEAADKVKPDIVIMDIKMPGINGMEAIKEIRKFYKEGYFIILTAYDYFDYAKEAIEYGVKEYMLKPFKRDELILKLEAAVKYIEDSKEKRREEIVLKEKIYTLIPMMENELCYSIINENLQNIDYKTHLNYLNIKLELGYSIILKINVKTGYKDKNNIKFDVNDYVREYLKRQNNAITSCIFTDNIVIFMEVNKNSEFYEDLFDFEAITKRLIEKIYEKFNLRIFAGIGGIYNNIEKLSKSYNEAMIAVNFTNEENNIKFYKDVSEMQNVIDPGNRERVNTESFNEGKSIILKATEYIDNNFKKDIMLEEVASFVNISSFYFSKIFKEYTGKNYVDYITDLRIEVAKEKLKEGSTSVKEICYEVGYNDPNYFSRVFKKIEGISPTEYRAKFVENHI